MSKKPRPLAKLSIPKLADVVQRKRLFNLLDDGRERPLLWITGQPGSGKTTLVASYVESKKLAHAWYQCDEGDADPATWFHYLQRNLELLVGRQQTQKRLSALTPEYLPDLLGFARRWFRTCAELLPTPAVMVFDNYQAIPTQAPIHALLCCAIEEFPESINVIVISRSEPPAEFARLQANRLLTLIGWDDLQLTFEETSKIAALDLNLSEETLRELHSETQGWVAGVTLMLERLRRTGQINRIDRGTAMQTVFNYFAQLLFAHAPAEDQRLLMEIAYLPSMTLQHAQSLTGSVRACELLETMFHRRLFVDRRAGSPVRYSFHALFRAFLLSRSEQDWNDEARRTVRQNAAQLLAQTGQVEDAYEQYHGAEDWQGVVGLILTCAPAFVKEGRWQTLMAWITSLPNTAYEASGWLPYWHGACLLAADPKRSQQMFENAYTQFLRTQDTLGQALAAAGVANGLFFEYVSFTPAGKWIAILEQLLSDRPQWPSAEVEFHVLCSFLILLVYHQPRHPLLEPCVTRLESLLAEPFDAGAKVSAASFMLHASSWWGNHTVARRIITAVQPMSLAPQLAPLYQSWWKIALCCNGILLGDPRLALTAARDAAQVVEANGLIVVKDKLDLYRLYAFLAAGDIKQSQQLCADLSHLASAGSPIETAMYLWERAWLALLQGDAHASLRDVERALQISSDLGVPNFEMHLTIGHALALNRLGRQSEALRSIARIRSDIAGTASPLFDFTLLTIEAEAAFGARDDVRGRARLAEAFAVARAHNQISSAQWMSEMMSDLCALALHFGIEPQYTIDLIKRRKLRSPSKHSDAWPWAIKVITLGKFELWLNREVYHSERKSPRRALELLKLLVSSGAHGLRVDSVLQTLWDDLDGDAAANALKACLHRLRKLLDAEDAIVLRGSTLTLNRELCWTDADAFEAIADAVVAASPKAPLAETNVASHAEQLLRLYRGHFLLDEAELGLVVPTRERLRSKFHRAVLHLGKALEDGAQTETALQLYLRALDLDNLAEDVYQRVISLHARRGDAAAALTAYRRCRQILSIVLGVQPSAETEALVRSLQKVG